MFTRATHRMKTVSEKAPTDFSVKTVAASDFILATREFIDENFRGAVRFEDGALVSGYVELSPSGFAYLIKLILNEVYGSSLVTLAINADNEGISVKVDCGLAKINLEIIESVAKSSGFSVEYGEGGILFLRLKSRRLEASVLYAISVEDLYKYITETFFG